MISQPRVSVLMNCFNGERYLNEAIESVYAQTYQNWEIIFVDNCSTDDSAKIAAEYDHRLKYFKTDKNISIGAARNWAMQFVRGKYLAFLDVDDLWFPQKLKLQVEQLENNPDYKLSYTGNYVINEKSDLIEKRMPKSKSGYVFPALLKHYEINQQTVLLKFDKKYCYFSEEHFFSADYNLFMRVLATYKAGVIRQYLVKYRKHSNSLTSRRIDRWWIEGKMTLDAILKTNPELKEKYIKEFKLAYAKRSYHKAIYDYSVGNDTQARIEMKKVRFRSIIYFGLYLLSLLPFELWRKIHLKYRGIKC